MKAKNTYRHLLAGLLLALYAFIATPVQLWHDHPSSAKATPTALSQHAKNDTVAAGTGIILEADCAVCSHKYSSYNDEVLAPYEISLVAHAVKYSCYSVQQLTASTASLPNKGPPVLC